MYELEPVVFLVVGVVIVNGIAGRIGIPAPILLVVAGLAVSFIPGVPDFQVNPEIVLTVLLPPLLFAAASEASVIAIRKLIRSITQLAVGMVLITAFSVAVVLHLLIPEIPFAAGLALGAIVAPPDAVAAVAVARRAGLPRNVVTVLEGESLFNDATSLVLLRVALVGISVGTMSWGAALGEFAWASVGGVLVGLVLGLLLSATRRITRSTLATTALSLVTPFLAYQLGELVLASGVLSVVVTGLVLGFRSPYDLQPEVRLTLRATWAAIQYVLEGAVFALIGLQLWAIVTAPDIGRTPVLVISAVVLATVILIRPIWIFLTDAVIRLFQRRDSVGSRRSLVAISWAGMRGVVSLAAAQTLPLDTPYRSLLLTCTIAVILGTLVVQGLSLPAVIRMLHLPGDPEADTLRERAHAREQANQAIAAKVEEVITTHQLPEQEARRMRAWSAGRDWRGLTDDAADTDQAQRRLDRTSGWRHELVGIERDVFVNLRNAGQISEDVLRELQYDLDLEEALLDRRLEAATGHLAATTAAFDDSEEATTTGALRFQRPDGSGSDSIGR
jgi:monovalent cation/hydrogen antiporter